MEKLDIFSLPVYQDWYVIVSLGCEFLPLFTEEVNIASVMLQRGYVKQPPTSSHQLSLHPSIMQAQRCFSDSHGYPWGTKSSIYLCDQKYIKGYKSLMAAIVIAVIYKALKIYQELYPFHI